MTLEEQLSLAEEQERHAKENKYRQQNGLPTLEEEEKLKTEIEQKKLLEETEFKKGTKEHLDKLKMEIKELQGKITFIAEQQTAIQSEFDMLNKRLDELTKKIGMLHFESDPELKAKELDTLMKIDRYLDKNL